MRRAGGVGTMWMPDGEVVERDTYTCAHCQRITHVKPKQRAEDIGGLCKGCMGLICPQCVGGDCVPFLRKLEEQEARYHALRSYGLA